MRIRTFLIFLLPIIISCSIYPPPTDRHERPIFIPRDYSLTEIKEYSSDYYNKILNSISLYEKFKNSLIDSLKGFDDLFIDSNVIDDKFFYDNIFNSKFAAIGLESIDIDTTYYLHNDTTVIRKPYFKIFKYSVPLSNYTIYQFNPTGPIENYLIISCVFTVVSYSRSKMEGFEYSIKLHPKMINNDLLINNIEIIKTDETKYQIPYLLRPLIWFKK